MTNEDCCWVTGNYTDDCDCALCYYKDVCSGYEGEEDDDEQH